MVKFSTKLPLDVRLESKRVRETARIISKVLKVSKETIRTRLRKQT
jgi:transcription initiation factor TFIIIB Brf1 subunit/transcription initiation factor TFIIB